MGENILESRAREKSESPAKGSNCLKRGRKGRGPRPKGDRR